MGTKHFPIWTPCLIMLVKIWAKTNILPSIVKHFVRWSMFDIIWPLSTTSTRLVTKQYLIVLIWLPNNSFFGQGLKCLTQYYNADTPARAWAQSPEHSTIMPPCLPMRKQEVLIRFIIKSLTKRFCWWCPPRFLVIGESYEISISWQLFTRYTMLQLMSIWPLYAVELWSNNGWL